MKNLVIFFASITVPLLGAGAGPAANIYVNSIPKCGTHLLTACIELLADLPLYEIDLRELTTSQWARIITNEDRHCFYATHMNYSPYAARIFRKHNYKTFLIYRDPRDMAISWVYWIYQGGWRGDQFASSIRKWPFKKVLKHVIQKIRKRYEGFLGWRREPSCLLVRFENLVGPQGGGTKAAQYRAIKRIAKHIGVPVNRQRIEYVAENMFGKSPTYRSGRIGEWKKHFDAEVKALFKKAAGDLVLKLDYEEDSSW